MKYRSAVLGCVLALGSGSVSAQTHSWTVFAGTPPAPGQSGGPGNSGSSDGTGTAARFNQPNFLTLDAAGALFVTDTGNATIRRITPAAAVSTFLGVAGIALYVDGSATLARFVSPLGLVSGPNNSLLVTEVVSHTLRQVAPDREVRTAGGTPGQSGSADATLSNARFFMPGGIAIDRDLNTYVADTGNHTIRKISVTSVVTTFAGTAGQTGTADGIGLGARFNSPRGLVVDRDNNLYVADTGNHTIRRITPSGVVTTFAGLGGFSGGGNGTGTGARFTNPWGIAIDTAGNLFVADTGNHTVRRITPAGLVSTIGGTAGATGHAEGNTAIARFSSPVGIAVDASGAVFVADRDNHIIARGALDTPPVIASQPQGQPVPPGAQVVFSVSATGGGLSYQWRRDGVPVPGATASSFTIPSAQQSSAGAYSVVVTNSAGSATSSAATLTVIPVLPPVDPGRIANLAIRSRAGTGDQTLIVGVAVGGAGTSGAKPVLIRGVGPTLTLFNVAGVLADPRLELYANTTKLSENDDWAGSAQIAAIAGQVGAFALGNTSKDAALYNPAFNPGSYSVWITGNGDATGIALAEIYDATPNDSFTPTTPRLTNVSARTQVGSGDDVLIAGFVIAGRTNRTVLIRAIGPTLATFGVSGALVNPRLELFDGQTKIYENDDWGGAAVFTAAFDSVAAFALPPASRDAVLLVTLAPGSYTAQVSGVSGTTGIALVEVYEVP